MTIDASLRRWCARAWLALVGLSFVFLSLVWTGVMVERYGWRLVALCMGLALWTRYSGRKQE